MSDTKTIDDLVHFYEHLTPESVTHFSDYYAENAYFKDPFNEVSGLLPIQNIFSHMFHQISEPRFVVLERLVDTNGAMLVWELHFCTRFLKRGETQVIRGVSHLKFNAVGKVVWHRDYWDAAEELYTKLPVIGCLVRGLKKMMTS